MMTSPGDPPRFIGRYRVLGELGRGGMGVVFLGEDPDLEREIAIKMLPPHLGRNPESYERFQREARLLAALNHPNVATIHSLEIVDGTPLLTMERIRGRTLAARLAEGPLSIEETLHLGTKVASAMEAAHDRGVIHRDLKPGNVMIRDDGEVKVLDFGLARSLSEPSGQTPASTTSSESPASSQLPTPPASEVGRRSMESDDPTRLSGPHESLEDSYSDPTVDARFGSGAQVAFRRTSDPFSSVAGTIGYMSPEQIRGAPLDVRSDLFAFGCVLFECITGAHTFRGDTGPDRIRATLEESPQLDELPAELSDPIRALIGQCLAKDPGDRPPSTQAVRRVLEDDLERLRFHNRTRTLTVHDLEGAGEIPNNLPHALSSFVGRMEELRVVQELLASHPLVTLTGAGGAGKTRLAIEAARTHLQGSASGGIWLIELAPLSDAALLDKTVMTAMGIAEQADRSPRESVLDRLAPLEALLVLDNCEHLVDAAADFVDALFRRCRDVRVLATSREPLGLVQEQRYPVPPLSAQAIAEEASLDQVLGSDAATLFVERARQVQPDFEVTEANREAIAGICRRLDGLPLALELAASRIRVLEPSALLSRLDQRFRILTGSSRERLPHHRTLAASLEWSHELLEESEQILYRRLGAFAGGFTLEAAEAVCVDERLEAWRVLDALTSLIDKSLVEFESRRKDSEERAPRYRMLETFRAYANERLQAAGEDSAIRRSLVEHIRRLVRDEGEKLNGPGAKEALERLDADYGNVREAIRIALTEMEDAALVLGITSTLVRYWMRRSYWSEGLGFLERALLRPGAEARSPDRARALNSLGTLEYIGGRYLPAIDHLAEAIELFSEHGMKSEAAFAQMGLGNTYCFLGRWQEASSQHEAVLQIAREINHRWLIAASLVNLCNVQEALGDLDRVDEAAREAVAVMEEVGDRSNLLMAQNYVAAVAYRRDRFEEALEIYERGEAIATEHGDRYHIGFQRMHSGLCRSRLGRGEEALADYLVALETAHEFDEPNLLATTLESYGNHFLQPDTHISAALAFGLADQVRSNRSAPLRDTNIRGVEESKTVLRTALGEERYSGLEEKGRRMTVAEFLERARAGTLEEMAE